MNHFDIKVQAGIALLDTYGPTDWRERINLDTLDLHSLTDCVLGQVYGDYADGMDSLFPGESGWLWNETNEEHGFEAPMDRITGNRQYASLTAAWKAHLTV